MFGYILMALGAYLVAEDLITARRAKNAELSEKSDGSSSRNHYRKSRTSSQKSDRNRRVKAIGIPVDKGDTNEFHKKPVQKDQPDTSGDSTGNDSCSQQDATSGRSKTKSIEGGKDVSEINSEDDVSNDGDHVDVEHTGSDEPDRKKAD